MPIRCHAIDQRLNTLNASYDIIIGDHNYRENISDVFEFDKCTDFQFKITALSTQWSLYIKFYKKNLDDRRMYTLRLTSCLFGITKKCLPSDEGLWRHIGTKNYSSYQPQRTFDIQVHMNIGPVTNPLATLHEDTEITDFELCGEDGSIKVHRAVLCMSSPVLMAMLRGEWKETKEGRVTVPGTSRQTLMQLKDYIYLHKVPESGFEQLLSVAAFYMMPDLEQICVEKLAENLTAENVWDVHELVVKHKSAKLLSSLLHMDTEKYNALMTELTKE